MIVITRPDSRGRYFDPTTRERLTAEAAAAGQAGELADELARRVNTAGQSLLSELRQLESAVSQLRERLGDGRRLSGGVSLLRQAAEIDQLVDRIDRDREALVTLCSQPENPAEGSE